MRLALTEQQKELLRSVREEQLADWRAGRPQIVDELFVEEEVVRLMSGLGHAAYLGLDGRVWVGHLGEGEYLEDPEQVASCIVRWAGTVGLPELVHALPPMPEGGQVCILCKGTREMPGEIWFRAEGGIPSFCRRCSGLGWTKSA